MVTVISIAPAIAEIVVVLGCEDCDDIVCATTTVGDEMKEVVNDVKEVVALVTEAYNLVA